MSDYFDEKRGGDDHKSSIHSHPSISPSDEHASSGLQKAASTPGAVIDSLEIGQRLTPHASAISGADLGRKMTGKSLAQVTTLEPAFEVDWDPKNSENPRDFSMFRKGCSIGFISFACTGVVLYSTSYTAGVPGIMDEFAVANETVAVLGVTTYLIGIALGSIIVAPLSEMYGRRPIYIVTQILFIILVLPCALAQNLVSILISRFFGALVGSALISNSPGTVADLVDENYRALAFSIWSIGPMQGPVIGPVIGGFVAQYLGWRWTYWVVMIWSGVALAMVIWMKETYAPTILRRKAAKIRKETGDSRYWSRYDDKKSFVDLLQTNMKRPFIMMFTEPICIFWDAYVGLVYAVLYLCFVAYPIVFSEQRGWSLSITGLSYLGIGTGSSLVIVLEPVLRKWINSHKIDPETGKPAPEAMVGVVCLGAIMIPVGELIFAWTCTPDVHWIAPIIAGIPFGFGNGLVFIYASNYLVNSYGVYAASALAGNAVIRSIMGAALPLAGPTMYKNLGSNWAGTMLALLEAIMIPIPFVFYRYGHKIRERSAWIRKLREDQEKLRRKRDSAPSVPLVSSAGHEEQRQNVEKELVKSDVAKV